MLLFIFCTFAGVGRILAIDYGTKRVGLAVTDPMQIIASGLTTVLATEIFDYLETYFQQETVETVVVGESRNFDGSDNHATQAIEKFVRKLKANYPKLNIQRQDESFSSKEAMESLILSGVKKKKRRKKELLDEVSAVIILQSYLGHR